MKIAAVNGQQELIATCDCAVGRDRAYKGSRITSPAG